MRRQTLGRGQRGHSAVHRERHGLIWHQATCTYRREIERNSGVNNTGQVNILNSFLGLNPHVLYSAFIIIIFKMYSLGANKGALPV